MLGDYTKGPICAYSGMVVQWLEEIDTEREGGKEDGEDVLKYS